MYTDTDFEPEVRNAWETLPADLVDDQACPSCDQLTRWDTTYQPNAWRHVETDTRWCSLDDLPAGTRETRMPYSAGNRLRRAKPYRTNPELWK